MNIRKWRTGLRKPGGYLLTFLEKDVYVQYVLAQLHVTFGLPCWGLFYLLSRYNDQATLTVAMDQSLLFTPTTDTTIHGWALLGVDEARHSVSESQPSNDPVSRHYIDMILLKRFASFGPYKLHWDEKTVSLHIPASGTAVSAAFPTMRLATSTVLQSFHSGRTISDADDFLVLFDLGLWLEANTGEFPASDLRNASLEPRGGLIREPSLCGAPLTLQDSGVDDTIKVLAVPKR